MDTTDTINVVVNIEEGVVPITPGGVAPGEPLIPGVPNTGFFSDFSAAISQNPWLAAIGVVVLVGLAILAFLYFKRRPSMSLSSRLSPSRRSPTSRQSHLKLSPSYILPVIAVFFVAILALPAQAITLGLDIASDKIEVNVAKGQSASVAGEVRATAHSDADVNYRITAQLNQALPKNLELTLANQPLGVGSAAVYTSNTATSGVHEIPLPLVATVTGEIAPGQHQIGLSLAVVALGEAPSVTSVAPATGSLAGGETLTVMGTSFYDENEVDQVLVGARDCPITAVTATTITCTTPAGVAAGSQAVRVVTNFGSDTLSAGFTYGAGGPVEAPNPLEALPRVAWAGGNEYWTQFPDAVKAGWNQPTFFPVGSFWDFWPDGDGQDAHDAVQFDKDHGINFYTHGNANQDACVLRDVGGMSWLGIPGSIQNLDTCGENVWPGSYLEDEIDGTSGGNAQAFAKLEQVSAEARALMPNKFVGVNYTSIPVQIWTSAADGGRYINDTFADMISIDDYLFSTPNKCNIGNPNWWPFIGPAPLTIDNCRQGHSYGRLTESVVMRDMMDDVRKPVSAFIDIYGGADPAAAVQVPGDIKAAVVSNLIHEAGFIIWFPLSFYPECGTNRLMDAGVPACAAPFTAAAGEVNNQVKAWAPILNTQSYEHTFGPSVDTMLKWYDGSAYIFAMTDGGTGTRTFTLPSGISNPSSVTEMISGSSVTVSGGAFSDTFTNNYDYRLYKVTP